MGKVFIGIIIGTCIYTTGYAATRPASVYVNPESYAYMYPYLSNQMRTDLNPGTTVGQTNNPIDVIVRTTPLSPPRRVVPRTSRIISTNARSATTPTPNAPQSTRRVVARSATNTAPAVTNTLTTPNMTTRARSGRTDPNTVMRTAGNTTVINYDGISTARCLADYTECMDRYCVREETRYNRCYCSAKLAQIDAKYQNTINDLIIQIIQLRGDGTWSEAEMNQYWMERVGNYVGENSWENLNNALNIQWPTPDERNRGQNAFLTGHDYCINHLRACAAGASNLRDAYRSQISRDCQTYEKHLLRIKTAAESIVQNYSE